MREGARVDVGVGCWGLRAGSEIDKSASAPGAEWMAMVPLTSQRKEKREERLKGEPCGRTDQIRMRRASSFEGSVVSALIQVDC